MRLTGPANVLIMPAIHSASISTKLIQSLGGATVIGPLLLACRKSVQICPLSASVSQILNMATFAAYDVRASSRGLTGQVGPAAACQRLVRGRPGPGTGAGPESRSRRADEEDGVGVHQARGLCCSRSTTRPEKPFRILPSKA